MAVNITETTPAGALNFRRWDVEMTLDADVTTGLVAHGFAGGPEWFWYVFRNGPGQVGNARLVVVDGTNWSVNKDAAVGSGAVGTMVTVFMLRPHSIVR